MIGYVYFLAECKENRTMTHSARSILFLALAVIPVQNVMAETATLTKKLDAIDDLFATSIDAMSLTIDTLGGQSGTLASDKSVCKLLFETFREERSAGTIKESGLGRNAPFWKTEATRCAGYVAPYKDKVLEPQATGNKPDDSNSHLLSCITVCNVLVQTTIDPEYKGLTKGHCTNLNQMASDGAINVNSNKSTLCFDAIKLSMTWTSSETKSNIEPSEQVGVGTKDEAWYERRQRTFANYPSSKSN